MPDIRSVSDETKWRIATRYSASLVSVYEKIFRPVIKKQYDEREQEIWIEMARFSYETAQSLKFPMKTARDLAESLRLVNTIVFGPDYKDEIIGLGGDGAVLIIKRCPIIMNENSLHPAENGTFHRCMALTLASQKKMNPAYSSRFVRAMCMGDRQCEIRIEPEKEMVKKPAG